MVIIMKKGILIFIISIFIVVFIIINRCYYKKNNHYDYVCFDSVDTTDAHIKSEMIKIFFHNNKKVTRYVYAEVDRKKFSNELLFIISDDLQDNYCNSNHNHEYSCLIMNKDNYVILEESGIPSDIFGIKKNLSTKEYIDILIKKGYECGKEENK